MPNNQAHDPRVATDGERVAQAVGLSVAAIAQAGVLIFSEDFETALQDGSTLANGAEVVASAKMSGTKTCRVNLKDSATDPLVTTPDNAATYEYNGTMLRDTDSSVVTAQWNFRFDDARWAPNAGAEASRVLLKGGYMGIYNNKVDGYYTVLQGGPDGLINLGDNLAQSDSFAWSNDPGRNIFWLHTGHEWGAGTGVHTFKITVDHSHPDYQQVRIWIDGNLAVNDTYAPDGIIRIRKAWRFESFSTCYATPGDISGSVDRTETACGIEFDNIRIYEGELT